MCCTKQRIVPKDFKNPPLRLLAMRVRRIGPPIPSYTNQDDQMKRCKKLTPGPHSEQKTPVGKLVGDSSYPRRIGPQWLRRIDPGNLVTATPNRPLWHAELDLP